MDANCPRMYCVSLSIGERQNIPSVLFLSSDVQGLLKSMVVPILVIFVFYIQTYDDEY
jgi:hypothetical protein